MPKLNSKSDLSCSPLRAARLLLVHEVSEDGRKWRVYNAQRDGACEQLFERFTISPVMH
jgi:hypothetical protein